MQRQLRSAAAAAREEELHFVTRDELYRVLERSEKLQEERAANLVRDEQRRREWSHCILVVVVFLFVAKLLFWPSNRF